MRGLGELSSVWEGCCFSEAEEKLPLSGELARRKP